MAVPFMDLSRVPPAYEAATRDAIDRVLGHRQFIQGPEVGRFEETVGAYLGVPALGVSSGTDALLLGLMALGLEAGDHVVTTPFSFFATAGVICRLGGVPKFVDIDPGTFELDPARLSEVAPSTVRGIIPVHLFGHVMDLDAVLAWAGSSVFVLEDAAQALGARDPSKRSGGTRGHAAAFSFFPTKNLGAFGDAGLLTVRDPETFERARRLRVHGQSATYVHALVGGNFRLDALQAAILDAALPYLDELCAARRRNAALYLAAFEDAGLLDGRLGVPVLSDGHSVHQFVVRIREGRRDAVRANLTARNIGCAIYYPLPFHLQPCFRHLGYGRGDFPEAESAADEVLALPIFPGLTPHEIREVVQTLRGLV